MPLGLYATQNLYNDNTNRINYVHISSPAAYKIRDSDLITVRPNR